MAELTYVKQGQRIGAHTINGIIDAVGGPSIPSDGDFTHTSRGSLFRKAYSTGAGITNKLYEFLDVKQAEPPSDLSCAYKMIYINLGRDLDFAKNKLDSDVILCYDGDKEDGFEVNYSDFYINGDGENGHNFYDGYVCTNLSAVQKFKASNDNNDELIGYGDGTLYGWNFEAKQEDATVTTFVVTNEYDEGKVKSFLTNKGYSNPELRQKHKLAVSTDSSEGNVLIKVPQDVEYKPEDIRFKLRGTVEKNDNNQKRFKIEYYQGHFRANNNEDTGVRWNNHQFYDATPNPTGGWHTLSVSNWMSKVNQSVPVYLNLIATYPPATGSGEDFHGQFEVSLEAAEEGRSVPHPNNDGTNSISSTYVIGKVDFEGDSVKVKQNIIGEQTFIELFNGEAIKGVFDDLSSEYFSVDSGLSVLQLSSIESHTYRDKYGAVLGHALELYQFHDLENSRDIQEDDKNYTDLIVRRQSYNGTPAEVQYMKFSSVLNELSDACSEYVDEKLSGITGGDIVGDSQISVLQLSSTVVDTITHKIIDASGQENIVSADAVSLFKFNDPDGIADKKYLQELSSHDLLLRHHDGQKLILEYWPLSNVLSTAEISVDTQIQNQTSSLQKLSADDGEWYQLYNFDKKQADISAQIWTIGDIESNKIGKVGKLIDPASKALLSVDILVRDNSTNQLKYMNLSVDSIKVDSYEPSATVKSIMYGRQILNGKYTDQNYITLRNFATRPNTKLSGVINNNGIVNITDENTWILTKKLNPNTDVMELTYDKLQLSVDLSAISSDIKCDTDSTPTQKSIEKNAGYIQLHDFNSPTITTKKTTLTNLSATYDLLDSDDSILVRSGNELKYKKLQIETKLPGGSGSTSGYTGTKTQATNLKFNSNGQYKVELWGCDFQYENGLLKSIGDEKMIATLDTVGYSGS